MPIATRYLLIVSMDVPPDREALFNEVYDSEHLPSLSQVPGVVSVTRLKREPLRMNLGGAEQSIEMADEPAYMAVYEIESPDVLLSKEWAEAGEAGRWNTEVRPFTTNRRHVLRQVI